MRLKKFINDHGIGLVEVMMGVAISGGLALTVAKLMENSSQATKTTEAKTENINLKGIVQNILTNPAACTYTFGPLVTQGNLTTLSANPNNKVTIPSIKDKTNTSKYSTASNNILPLTITSMYWTNYLSSAGTGDLVITSTFKKSSSMTIDLKPIKIPINFNINNSNPSSPVLVACNVMAVGGGEWLLAGNAGTVDGTDFIGTSDNVPLNFKVNSQKAGRIDSTSTTFFGYQAGNSTTGPNNTAFGFQALFSNTTGDANQAFGLRALYTNTTGYDNVAMGMDTLQYNSSGNNNIAIGRAALQRNTTAVSNIAMGNSTLYQNTIGNHNVGIGQSALLTNTTGQHNIAIGNSAVSSNTSANYNFGIGQMALNYNTTGAYNIGIGSQAMWRNTTGSNNTAIGHSAGAGTAASAISNNVFVGYQAGSGLNSGSNNIFLGSNSGSGVGTMSDHLYIGNGAGGDLIEGNFSSAGRFIRVDGNLVIGSSNPLYANTVSNAQKGNLVIGQQNTVNSAAMGAIAAGVLNTVNSVSFAFGHQNNVPGWASFAVGQTNTVNASKSMAIGWGSTINTGADNSQTIGSANSVSHDYATVMGINAVSHASRGFTANYSGGYKFITGSGGAYMNPNAAGWTGISDRNAKHNVREIDLEAHLRKIAKLPLYHWMYKGSDDPHMGPMAQDFYYIFRLGDGDDKGIATGDIEGVTIVAVKALEIRTRELQKRNEALEEKNRELEERLEKLEALLVK